MSEPAVIPEAAVEAAAKALVWERDQGCLAWDDADYCTQGLALKHARAALEAAFEVLTREPEGGQ